MQVVRKLWQSGRPLATLAQVWRQPPVGLLSLSATQRLKEIVIKEDGDAIQVKGLMVSSPREEFMVKTAHDDGACPLCRLNLDVKHTDVLILSQFVRTDGCMLPRRITGLCRRQQKRVQRMVAMAQKAGLMMNLTPDTSKKDPKLRRDWKRCNQYFDEDTLEVKVVKKGTWWRPKARQRRGFHPHGGLK